MNDAALPHDAFVPATATEWSEWLIQEEERTTKAYFVKPENLIADYNRERQHVSDYEGREILELLQNANDQAAEQGKRARVLIDLTREGLIVANTGAPFSVGGVRSLQISSLSPKRHVRKRLIGNKGLGFRSVLNWSRTPIILSGALRLAYSKKHAVAKLDGLMRDSSLLRDLIANERRGGDAVVLPFLSFPLYTQDGDLSRCFDNEVHRQIFHRCERLLGQGYDTVIGMPFADPDRNEDAAKQIDELRPEILLFAQHLGELSFTGRGDKRTWKRIDDAGLATVLANGEKLGQWRLYRKEGKLPDSAMELDHPELTDYEVIVALSHIGAQEPGPLFSHFPTDISLPLPVTCHATLELEQNRKHAQQGRVCNNYVLEVLAALLVEIAEELASQTTDVWAGCSLLMPQGSYSSDLQRESFPDKLIQFAKARHILPTLSGRPAAASSARVIPSTEATWLPENLFPEVVPTKNLDQTRFVASLGVQQLEIKEMKARFSTTDGLTLEERVAAIVGITERQELREASTSALLLNTSKESIAPDVRVFLSPRAGAMTALPSWAGLVFLNEELRAKLVEAIGTGDSRQLQQKLSNFGLREYSLANVVGALVHEANQVVRDHPEDEATVRTDLLRAVFALYRAEDDPLKRPSYPDQSQLYLWTQANQFEPANALYLGSDFGILGEIAQALYSGWASAKLIDPRDLLNLTADRVQLAAFLVWIGLSRLPRDVKIENPNPEFTQHVLRSLKYPVRFEEKIVGSERHANAARVGEICSIDGLEGILSNAEPVAIAAWLAVDERTLQWARPNPLHATLSAFPDGVYRARQYQGSLPSYVRWNLETTPWLRSATGESLRPKDCVLGERAIEDLFPRPAMPASAELERFGLRDKDILLGWDRGGVLTSLSYLDRDQIYAKLLELPQRSPDGKLARPLYHWLLDASEIALGSDGPNRDQFLATGKMWARHGQTAAYFPVNELYHADAEDFPAALLEKLKIVDLRKRVGAAKVEQLFGVKPVDRAGIRQSVLSSRLAVGSSDANREFQAVKHYLHRLRASQTSQVSQLQTLKDLQLEVCSTLQAELTLEEAPLHYDVPVWGWIMDEQTLYVRSDPGKPMSLSDALLADAIGEALATLFRIADGGDFARIIACKEGDRLELLRRLRGDVALENIEELRKQYSSFDAKTSLAQRFPIPSPPVQKPFADGEMPPSIEPAVLGYQDTKTALEPPAPLQVSPKEHVTAPVSVPRKLQVKRVHSVIDQRPERKRAIADGDFCERKAMEFEEAEKRWPLSVGQIMGTEGFGCDVLSFSSEEAREVFRAGIHELSTVVRFIEVKGRSDASAVIELSGNELSAAEKYGERYYLYRLFGGDYEVFDLTVLQNPLTHKEALQPAVHVALDRAKAERYSLEGGLKKNDQ